MCNKIIENEIKNIILRYNKPNEINSIVKDLTHLKTYSIDDSDTIEIDDAVSLEKIKSQYKLWIHIASPTSYIKYESAIDKNARRLISTVYLSTNTYYMLPEKLIHNVLSLSSNEKREALSIGVILNDDGRIVSSEIVKSLIKVDYRLNYTDADELIDYAPKEEEDLSLISTLLKSRNCWRKNAGAIEILESYGKMIVVDKIPKIKIIDPTLSRQLISEAMILYGNIISNFTKLNKIPVPYRVQEHMDKVNKKYINDSENEVLYNFLLKKTMGKSFYSIYPMAHYSLGLNSYLHATSPIRRYTDLIVHFQLNRFLNHKDLIPRNDVEQIIHQANNLGRQNIMRYRDDQKYWLCKWFENKMIKEYKVLLLNWINRYKNLCILYFLEYNFSTICNLNTKENLNIGNNYNVKYLNNDNNDHINYFELMYP
tara:strand:- start:461 stop:1741 length:1281 start_codon:yes stop_codon:yes gene_type:complete